MPIICTTQKSPRSLSRKAGGGFRGLSFSDGKGSVFHVNTQKNQSRRTGFFVNESVFDYNFIPSVTTILCVVVLTAAGVTIFVT